MNTSIKAIAMLAMSTLIGAGALAADAGDKPAPPQAGGWHHPTPEQMRERMAKRQAVLHDQLKLTAAQEPAWKNFVAAMTPDGMGMDRAMHDRAAMEKMSAPERLERHLQMTKQREAKMESALAAMKTFYATLTPQQQQIFNQQTMMHHGWRHGRGHGEGGKGPGGEPRPHG